LSIVDDFLDPIIYTKRTGPFNSITDEQCLISGNRILLQEIPDKLNRVQIKYASNNVDLYELPYGSVLSEGKYYVNYTNGIINFNSADNGKNILCKYYGRGVALYPSSRIWVEESNNEVQVTLQDLIDTIDNLEIKGIWNFATAYELYNIVSFGNFSYIATQISTNKQPDVNPDYWLCLSELGNFQHRGNWSSITPYYKNNMVTHNGSSYMCIVNNTNKNPSTENTYWKLVALAGSVISVSSANSDIRVATGTTTPVLTLNSGVNANQIVKHDVNANIPTNSVLFGGKFKLNYNNGLNSLDVEYVG